MSPQRMESLPVVFIKSWNSQYQVPTTTTRQWGPFSGQLKRIPSIHWRLDPRVAVVARLGPLGRYYARDVRGSATRMHLPGGVGYDAV